MSGAGFIDFLGFSPAGLNITLLLSRLFFAVFSILGSFLAIGIIAAGAHFTSAREEYSSAGVLLAALFSSLVCGLFFRENAANFLLQHMFFYRDFASFVISKTNANIALSDRAFWPLFVASSSIITVLSALLALLATAAGIGVGGQWTRRGSVIQSAGGSRSKNRLKLGGTTVPANIETRGFAFFGTTGTGKTQAFMRLAETARERGQRLIAVDPDGDLMSRFYRKGDVILNPQDARSVSWSVFADIKHISEIQDIAESIIPEGFGENKSWFTSARTLTAAILEGLLKSEKLTTGDFLHIALFADIEEIIKLVKGTEAERTMSGSNTKGRDSILSIIAESLRAWRALDQSGKASFSLRDWIRADDNDAWLWMPYSASSSAASAPLRRTFIDIIAREIMTLKEDPDRRIWLFLDELHEHGQLDILPRLTARGRKYGLAHVLGIHSISQLREVYGEHQAVSIMSTTGNKLILKQADPETAEYCSQQIGDRESERKDRSRTASEQGLSKNTSYQRQIDRAVLPAELMNKIPDLHGYLLLSGRGIFKAKLEYLSKKYPRIFEPEIKKKSTEKTEEKAPKKANQKDKKTEPKTDKKQTPGTAEKTEPENKKIRLKKPKTEEDIKPKTEQKTEKNNDTNEK